jgi:hypothetical protein
MSDKWKCEQCSNEFSVGEGFLGSMEDFEFQMSKEDEQNKELMECSPFMNFVQLCQKCYDHKLKENGNSKK